MRIASSAVLQRIQRIAEIGRATEPIESESPPVTRVGSIDGIREFLGDVAEQPGGPAVLAAVQGLPCETIEGIGGIGLSPRFWRSTGDSAELAVERRLPLNSFYFGDRATQRVASCSRCQ